MVLMCMVGVNKQDLKNENHMLTGSVSRQGFGWVLQWKASTDFIMLELLQLTETLLVATTLSLAVVATPIALVNGDEPPNIQPLLEHVSEKGEIDKDT